MSYHHTHDHNHQERFCPACENGAYGAGGGGYGGYGGGYGGSSPRDYSRNTVRAIAAEKKRVQRRKKEVLALKQKIDSLDREQLELYHTILQNERLAALDTLRHCAQEANADIQAAKDKLAEVEQTNANKGYFGVAHLKEDVEAANKSVYRLRSEVTAASAELLEVIALEDNEPIPEPEPVSPVKSLHISKRGDIDITFDQPEPSGYTSLVNTPQPMPRFNHSQQRPYSMSVRSAPPQLKNSYRPSPVYHHYDRGSFNRTPVTDRLMMSSPRMRTLLPAHRQSRATLNPAGSVGYNVHEASNPLHPKGYTVPFAAPSPGASPRLRNPGADRTYQPEAYESDYNASVMGSSAYAPPPPPPPASSSPVRNLHISNRGDIDITMSGDAPAATPWRSGSGFRPGSPASSFRPSQMRSSQPVTYSSPAAETQRINHDIRTSPGNGALSQSVYYDAPMERTSPVGAETFNKRYNQSVRRTGL